MILRKRDLERIFRKLCIEERKSKHHIRGYLIYEGKKILSLHYSFGRGDMPGRISEKFRKSLNASAEELEGLVECSIDGDQYIELLRKKGIIQ